MRSVPASVDLTTVIFSIFATGWLLCPIFAFGLDGTLDHLQRRAGLSHAEASGEPDAAACSGVLRTRGGHHLRHARVRRGGAIPIIILGNLTSGASPAIRLPVLFGCAAAYGFGLAWLGVRAAAILAEGKLPELRQIAMRTSL